MKTETRYMQSEVRADEVDGKPVISGYAALYGVMSLPLTSSRGKPFRERIAPGTFANLEGRDVVARYNHDLLLGRTLAGTLTLIPDDKGLRYEIRPSDSALADHVVKAISRGDVRGSSFAFQTIQDHWAVENGETIRELRSIGLIDVGPVDFPAYPATASEGSAVSIRAVGAIPDEVDASIERLSATPLRDARQRVGTKYPPLLRDVG